jgi:hypothetical protein
MKKNFSFVLRILSVLLILGFMFTACGTLDLNRAILGKEDMSVNWQMVEAPSPPSINTMEKLSNTSADASAIYRFADRAHAEDNKWYIFTAEERPGETFYAYRNVARDGKSWTWEVYKKK